MNILTIVLCVLGVAVIIGGLLSDKYLKPSKGDWAYCVAIITDYEGGELSGHERVLVKFDDEGKSVTASAGCLPGKAYPEVGSAVDIKYKKVISGKNENYQVLLIDEVPSKVNIKIVACALGGILIVVGVLAQILF